MFIASLLPQIFESMNKMLHNVHQIYFNKSIKALTKWYGHITQHSSVFL